MNLTEAVIGGSKYLVDNTISCGIGTSSLWLRLFAIIGFITVVSGLISVLVTKGLKPILYGIAYVIGFFNFFKKDLFKKKKGGQKDDIR